MKQNENDTFKAKKNNKYYHGCFYNNPHHCHLTLFKTLTELVNSLLENHLLI